MSETINEKPWVVTFIPDDTLEEKLKKASQVRPSDAQLAWMEKEYIAFIHFGPNTFSGRQWGTGKEDPSDYKPVALDPTQWAKVCAQAGFKMAVFTLKHHDGFCQWFTDTTDFSTINSPVKKDLAKLLQEGCEENQIDFGVYLSPWDMYQRDRGLWNTDEYNNYLLDQLNELLTRYGPVHEVWFDGACADYEIWKKVPSYKPDGWYDLIEETQPTAVYRMYDPYYFATEDKWEDIKAGKAKLEWRGKAVRWVGNEEGMSRADEWSVQPVYDSAIDENATFDDLGQEKYYQNAVGAIWYPVEVNTTVLNQWFWDPDTSRVKSLSELIDVYYNSTGNNGVLLLNISPDRNGLVPEDQIIRLMQLKDFTERTFSNNLASDALISASVEAPSHGPDCIINNNKETYWTSDGEWDINSSSASIIFDLGQNKTFDNVMVQEYIREGQRIAEWSFEIWDGQEWQEMVHHKTIGYKNIKRFEKVTSNKVKLNILRSWDNPMISNFGLYLTDIPEGANETEDVIEEASEPISIEAGKLDSGIRYSYYNGGIQSAALIETTSLKLDKTGILETINIQPAIDSVSYSFAFNGYIRVPIKGIYTFRLESADGSVMFMSDKLLINNDEPHDVRKVDKQIALKAGYYPIKVLYTSFRNNGQVKLSWGGPGFGMEEITANNLCHIR